MKRKYKAEFNGFTKKTPGWVLKLLNIKDERNNPHKYILKNCSQTGMVNISFSIRNIIAINIMYKDEKIFFFFLSILICWYIKKLTTPKDKKGKCLVIFI